VIPEKIGIISFRLIERMLFLGEKQDTANGNKNHEDRYISDIPILRSMLIATDLTEAKAYGQFLIVEDSFCNFMFCILG